MGQVLQQASQTPPTDYSMYNNGLSADDRMKLAQQILARQNGGGNAVISGIAGLGDALAKSYGHDSSANAQGNVRAIQQGVGQQQLAAVDTARQQKLQDVQAKMTLMENDPNSSMSAGFRTFMKSQGVQVPSGMSAAMLKSQFPDMGKILEARIVAATAGTAQNVDLAKSLVGESVWDRIADDLGIGGVGEEYGTNKLAQTGLTTSPTSSTSGWSVKH